MEQQFAKSGGVRRDCRIVVVDSVTQSTRPPNQCPMTGQTNSPGAPAGCQPGRQRTQRLQARAVGLDEHPREAHRPAAQLVDGDPPKQWDEPGPRHPAEKCS
jgi:hypothetical protein